MTRKFLTPFSVASVPSLPPPGEGGFLVRLSSDGHLYYDKGTELVKLSANPIPLTSLSQFTNDPGYITATGGTFTGQITSSKSTGVIGTSNLGSRGIEVWGNGTGHSAFMVFHRPGEFAAAFGIDADNIWKVGGWSMGNTSYALWHEGNLPVSVAASANSVVKRDANGYLKGNFINMSDEGSATNGTVTGIICKRGDDYYRGTSATSVRSFLGVNDVFQTEKAENVITSATTLVKSRTYEGDTSGGAFSVTLPLTPSIGDWVMLTDHKSTFNVNNLTVSRNGQLIMGLAEDLIIDIKNATLLLVFVGGTKGWAVK